MDTAYGEWIANGKMDDYESKVVDKVKVLKQFGYFNALGNGTWYDKYPDTLALENFISNHFPPIRKS